jgi:chromosomal replication initiation ATPase DnaA
MSRRRPELPKISLLCAAAAASVYAVDMRELAAPTRGRASVAAARGLAVYLQHVVFGASLSACGRAFGRDRASVRHACARVEDRRDDPRFDRAVARLETALAAELRVLASLSHSNARRSTGDQP